MTLAKRDFFRTDRVRIPVLVFAAVMLWALSANCVRAAGVAAGITIDNTATISFEIDGVADSMDSNTVSITVLERTDLALTLQSADVLTEPGESNAVFLITLTNTGNGSDQFSLAIDNAVGGDDFDPQSASTAIYFDTDGSGDLSAGDVAYVAGTNDPVLAADASVDLLIVNDIPAATTDGMRGLSRVIATSLSASGVPGDLLAGAGDGGIDAVVGASGGVAEVTGTYVIRDVQVLVSKSFVVTDQDGGAEPRVGATLTYRIDVSVTNSGTAINSVINDPVPAGTSYVASSIRLNTIALTDADDADAGRYDISGPPSIIVALGTLDQASGVQTIEFQVTIDE